jgi:hypothetical protein
MHTFIDESGSFGLAHTNEHSFACVGATVIPSARLEALSAEFSNLVERWPKEKGEPKGKLLNEDQFDEVLRLFQRYRVRIQAVVCDMTMHSESDISNHQQQKAQKLVDASNKNVSSGFRKELLELAQLVNLLSIPEYVQMCMLNELIHEIQRRQILWAALNDPTDLSSFRWVIDAKDEHRTKMEKVWNDLLMPSMEYRSIQEPSIHLEDAGADYSYLPSNLLIKPDERLLSHLTDRENAEGFDLRVLFQDLSFLNSTQSIGVQMADIAASCVRRALRGTLKQAGWRRLPNLMVRPLPPGRDLIKLVTLGELNHHGLNRYVSYRVMRKLFDQAPKWPWQEHSTSRRKPRP